ncbi:MAG: hypothetical protein J7K33_06130 [Candidatus Marinimicrobia bacterium]|nr:hypothetical protein [Candidatus Neomarinimicrobiota bacterium]
MIIRRVISMMLDVISALLPAYGASLGGLNFLYSFVAFLVLSQIVEIIYFKGQTFGMVVLKIRPEDKAVNKISIVKLVVYHIALSIIIINIFNPFNNIFTKYILPVVLLFPFHDTKNYNSVLDILFRIHWIKQ